MRDRGLDKMTLAETRMYGPEEYIIDVNLYPPDVIDAALRRYGCI